MRSDEHTVTACFVRGLDDELVEVFENVLTIRVTPAQICRHVWKNRVFAQLILDHLGDIRVHDFVVGDAVSWSVGERDVAGAISFHQTRDP